MRYIFAIILSLALILTGCASFQARPGQRISLPHREMVLGSNLTVSVRLLDGDYSPMCMLPDASNEIACIFYYGHLERSPEMVWEGGYRFLSLSGARVACSRAMWSIGNGSMGDTVGACARALAAHRWMDDADRYEPGPGEPRQ